LEFRIAKKPGSSQLELIKGRDGSPSRPGRFGETSLPRGGKKFADLLWPNRVLIEMKSRGQNLEKHYDQAFEYWTHIVPKRPPYVILCNFDEFWIYDFNTQLFDPVERVSLRDLPQSISAFNFLLPTPRKPIFDNIRVEVTRKAADRMAPLSSRGRSICGFKKLFAKRDYVALEIAEWRPWLTQTIESAPYLATKNVLSDVAISIERVERMSKTIIEQSQPRNLLGNPLL
jgi:hypothetical protein